MSDATLAGKIECCVHGSAAYCTAACPFGLDLRDLMSKLSRGNFDAALRALRGAVIFPEIVSALCERPCEGVCLRAEAGDAMEIGRLERACITLARRRDIVSYNMPSKGRTVVIIGAGLCGLAAAMRLAQKKYHVIVYDREPRIGGRLWETMNPDVYLSLLQSSFAKESIEWHLEESISCAQSLPDYDVLLIATGGSPSPVAPDKRSLLCLEEPGESAVAAIARGISASTALECLLKTGRMGANGNSASTLPANAMDPHAIAAAPRIKPLSGEDYTRDEAKAEAARCLMCDCTRCYDRCSLMQHYRRLPSQLREDVFSTLYPISGDGCRVAMHVVASCDLCGLCSQRCPYGVDIGAMMQRARETLVEQRSFPPAYHDFWLKDMAFSNDEAAFLSMPDNCHTLFFPGCQLGASNPHYVTGAWELLKQVIGPVGLWISCCGIPAQWAGETEQFEQNTTRLRETLAHLGNPRIIFSCPTCRKTFARLLPYVESFSLCEALNQAGFLPPKLSGDESVAVFDPCSSRDFASEQQAVRSLLRRAGATIQELSTSGCDAACCGWGGHADPANYDLVAHTASVRAALSPLPYITYCANCRDFFADAQKDCRHILDVLLGFSEKLRPAPTVTERRQNRLHLRQMLENAPPILTDDSIVLSIPAQLSHEISRRLILEDDIRKIVSRGERLGECLYDTEQGVSIGHLQCGVATLWAIWRAQDDGSLLLVDAYSHRMSILEAQS
ncbi:MAG: NAD(P)-binding protein [Oscillospiraceae bacterium]